MRKLPHLLYLLAILSFVFACGSDKTASISSGSSSDGDSSALKGDSTVPKIDSIVSQLGKGEYREGELIVKFKSGVQASSLRVHDAVGASAVKRYSAVPNLELVKLPGGLSVKDAIVQYMSDPNVEYAEPNYIRRISAVFPNDTNFRNQWALHNTGTYAGGTADADIDAPEAWDISTGTNQVVIAVLDTGIDYNHTDLMNNIFTNPGDTIQDPNNPVDDDSNGFQDDFRGWNFMADLNNDGDCRDSGENILLCSDPGDDHGHGTHVAGIIGAVGNNGIGITGVMWSVSMMPLKVCDASGDCPTSDEISAIDYLIMMKNRGVNIKAINASFGGGPFSQAEFQAIERANAAGILFVAAAGNGGDDLVGDNNDVIPHYPSSYDLPNIISVTATDQDDIRVPFSNYGLNSVDVAAPGVYIFSTVPNNLFLENEFLAGTSMAAPHVTGLVGLLSSYYDGVQNTLLNHLQVHDTILRSVDKKPTLDGWIKTGGRINAYLALSSLAIPANLAAEVDKGPLRVSLVWEDRATGEDGYKVERRAADGDFVEIQILPAGSSTFTDTSIAPQSNYAYRVKAFNSIAESFYSNEVSVWVPKRRQSGGGGGCSVGAHQNSTTAIADVAVMLTPFILIAILRRRK